MAEGADFDLGAFDALDPNEDQLTLPHEPKDSKPQAPAVIVGPLNVEQYTGRTWRFVCENWAREPHVRVLRSGKRIVGVVLEDLVRLAEPSTAPEAEASSDELGADEEPASADAILARLGHRRSA